MKFLALFALFVAASASEFSFGTELDEDWENFKKKFGKQYSGEEEKIRRSTFEQNVKTILHHNLKADLGMVTYTYRVGVNEFADMSHEEFQRAFNGFIPSEPGSRNGSVFTPAPNAQVPRTVDWREHGLVTRVKNQYLYGRPCESCYAFSSTGSLEGQHKKKTGVLVSLSEQQIVDCSHRKNSKYHNNGCNKGYMSEAFRYIHDEGGIDTEESYPYTATDGQCHFQSSSVGATVTRPEFIESGNEYALMNAVATVGPISAAMDAREPSFQFYQSGYYGYRCRPQVELTHAVLIVGYGSENGQDYWLIKNSFGENWGERGYFKLGRNQNNQCGIANQPLYPIV